MKSIQPKKTLRQRFIAVKSDSLVIETIQTENLTGRQHLRAVELKGTWRANEYNEFVFDVALRKGPPQSYTFKGSWKLNQNQQIEYTFDGGRDTLTFQGYWNILSANRIVYLFEGSSKSRFEFKVQLESSVIYPKKGQICYRIGVGVRRNRLTAGGQLLILYGEWKFGRNLKLLFNMDYGQSGIKAITFGAEVTFGLNKVIFALTDESAKPLGLTLTVTHKFLKTLDAEVFIKLKSRQNEHSIEGGIAIPF